MGSLVLSADVFAVLDDIVHSSSFAKLLVTGSTLFDFFKPKDIG